MNRESRLPRIRLGANLFTYVSPYKIIASAHAVLIDTVVLVPMAALLYIWVLHAPQPDPGIDRSPRVRIDWNLTVHMFSIVPAITAFTLSLVIIRFGRQSRYRLVSGDIIAVASPPQKALVITCALLALLNAVWVTGPIATRFAPCFVAIPVAVLARLTLSRTRLRTPTNSGFKPPIKILIKHRARRHVRASSPSPLRAAQSEREGCLAAAEHFDREQEVAGASWALARYIDLCMSTGHWNELEATLNSTSSPWTAYLQTPPVAAASAQFYAALGDHASASAALQTATSGLVNTGARIPRAVKAQVASINRCDLDDAPRFFYLLMLIWQGHYAYALSSIRNEAQERADPRAIVEARLLNVVNFLSDAQFHAELPKNESLALLRLRASLEASCGEELLDQAGREEEALGYFLRAAIDYQTLDLLPDSGTTLTKAGVLQLRLAEERIGRDYGRALILFGLGQLESVRGRLTRGKYRRAAIIEREAAIDEAFSFLADTSIGEAERNGELALWMAEALRRNALSDYLRLRLEREEHPLAKILRIEERRMGVDLASHPARDDAAVQQLRDKIAGDESRQYANYLLPRLPSVSAVHKSLRGLVGLHYRLVSATKGWSVTIVASLEGVSRVFRTDVPADEAAAEILNEFTRGPIGVALKHRNRPFRHAVWRSLASAVFPQELIDLLRSEVNRHGVRAACIFPDGPLLGVPFTALLELATRESRLTLPLFLCPNSSCLQELELGSLEELVVHSDDELFASRVAGTSDLSELSVVLLSGSGVDLIEYEWKPSSGVAIYTHGIAPESEDGADAGFLLADGSLLSSTAIRHGSWPDIVVTGACESAWTTTEEGVDPLGIPISFFLAGCKLVIGVESLASHDPSVRELVASVCSDICEGHHPLISLWSRQRSLAESILVGDHFAIEGLNMVCWTTCPPRIGSFRPIPEGGYWTESIVGDGTTVPLASSDWIATLIPEEAPEADARLSDYLDLLALFLLDRMGRFMSWSVARVGAIAALYLVGSTAVLGAIDEAPTGRAWLGENRQNFVANITDGDGEISSGFVVGKLANYYRYPEERPGAGLSWKEFLSMPQIEGAFNCLYSSGSRKDRHRSGCS